MSGSIAIDTNLLVLFVVGAASRSFIPTHRRCGDFAATDLDLLNFLIKDADDIVLTPNTLSETSNLIGYTYETARLAIFAIFQQIIESMGERYLPSQKAAARKEFPRLGLTDAALLEIAKDGAVVLTNDIHLFLAVENAGCSAINFNDARLLWNAGRIAT